jgi:hypothetical protein
MEKLYTILSGAGLEDVGGPFGRGPGGPGPGGEGGDANTTAASDLAADGGHAR